MYTLLSELSMSLGTAFMHYLTKIVMYGVVAAIGVFVGIKLRKRKNAKED